MDYNDDFSYPEEAPSMEDSEFVNLVHPDHAPLIYRRKALGMTQQQVADPAGITLRQYQKFESGERTLSSATMRIGLAICHVLNLDPYRFVNLPTSK